MALPLHAIDGDLEAYHEYNSDGAYSITDALGCVAQVCGYPDGEAWHWIVALKDGTFALTEAWCDYTGWD
ncbi:MAG: hypothetical protein HN396_04430 [Gemmatimonadales bacterium]|jgi:hypothetical protein|nr:hypothetical protein [Gemmatimonadales bacterium]